MLGIYKILSPSNKIYIGQSINIKERWKKYEKLHKSSIGPKIYNSFSKYGFNSHVFEVIEECSVEQLNERETYWKQIELDKVKGDWDKVLFCELYDKGGGPKSEETKQKIGKSNSKPKTTTENMKKPKYLGFGDFISNLKKGYKFSEKSKEKMRISHKGFKHSEETKQKMINASNMRSVIQLDKNNNVIKEYQSITTAKNQTGIKGISNVLVNLSKTAGGYKWIYKQQ
jgi:group I intron endonuclease